MSSDPSPQLAAIRRRVAAYRSRREPVPGDDPRSQAAVAMILFGPHDASGPEVLFIERAQREGDPWSGQMAFPGGRREPLDPDLATTAARETLEEVGIELPQPIGMLDDVSNRSMRQRVPEVALITVTPYVYVLNERPSVVANHEVASTVWVPLDWILHTDSSATHRMDAPGFRGNFPAFVYERYKVWGMTYRLLEMLTGLLELRLPGNQEYPGIELDQRS